jgi:hypothetical protein
VQQLHGCQCCPFLFSRVRARLKHLLPALLLASCAFNDLSLSRKYPVFLLVTMLPFMFPLGTYVLDLWLSLMCMRSKAWLAARVSLRLPRTAQRSRRLRSTRAAAPVLLAHALVTKNIVFFQWVLNVSTPRFVLLLGSPRVRRL